MSISNSQLFNLCRAYSPTFANLVAGVSADTLDSTGMEALSTLNPTQLNEWYGTALAFMLQKIDVAQAKNPLESTGIVETYSQPEAMYAERIAVLPQKGNSPMYMNLSDGDSVDQQIVRKGEYANRFFSLNMNYQNWTTLDDFRKKTMFSTPFGMDLLTSGIMSQLENDYKKFRYVTALRVLNQGINSTTYAMKTTQNIALGSWTDGAPTSDELIQFILALNNIESEMTLTPSTSAFNAAGFETNVDRERYTVLVRADVLNNIKASLTTGVLFGVSDSFLKMPFDVEPTLNFGGLEPFTSSTTVTAGTIETFTGTFTSTSRAAIEGDTGNIVGDYYVNNGTLYLTFAPDSDIESISAVTSTQGTVSLQTVGNDLIQVVITGFTAGTETTITVTGTGKVYSGKLYPVYDNYGRELGFSTTEGQTGESNVTVSNGSEIYKDRNNSVIALVIQKGAVVETVQNPVRISPAPFNAGGLYQNFFLNAPNNGMNFDYYYNMVAIRKPNMEIST